jgi:hypothetical protein
MRFGRVFFVFGLVGLCAMSDGRAAERKSFKYAAEIAVPETQGAPVRISIPRDVLSTARVGLPDARIFDDAGTETPYVVRSQQFGGASPTSFGLKAVSYKRQGKSDVIVLELPENSGSVNRLDLETGARDFRKSVKVESSSDRKSWAAVADDAIFDFSSRIDLRRTGISFADTACRYVRLTLADAEAPTADGPDMDLRYQGLEFSVKGKSTAGAFRVNRVTGWAGQSEAASAQYDRASVPQPKMALDKIKNSVVALGEINLSLDSISVSVENPYYYRRVEVWGADQDEEKAYRMLAGGVIYRVVGMAKSENVLRLGQVHSRFLKLKILNGDNPPLRLKDVELTWLKQSLYFVPEAGRSYVLYVGSEDMRAPDYDLGQLLTGDAKMLQSYREGHTKELKPNAEFNPSTPAKVKAKQERKALKAIILLLVMGLVYWMYRLLKKLPARPGA